MKTKPWESNPRAVPLDSNAYPADWSQPTFGDREDAQSPRHIEMKKRAIDFLREQYISFYRRYPEREPYIETERLWLGSTGDFYLDVVLMDAGQPAAAIEVGRCAEEKLKDFAKFPLAPEVYHWPYEEEKPLRVVMPWEPGYDPDRLKFEPVEQVSGEGTE